MSVDQVVELLSKGEGLTTDDIARHLNIVEKAEASKAPAKAEPSQAARDAVAKLNEQAPLPTAEADKKTPPPSVDLPACLTREISRLEQHLALTVNIPSVRDPFIKTETLQRLALLMDPTISTVLLDIVKDLQRFNTLSKEVADATGSKA